MFSGYGDLLRFLERLPEPEEVEDIAACSYSDAIDDISLMLVDYRMQHEMTQADLANHLSISQSMISQYESGARNISLNTLCTLMAKIGKKVVLTFEDAVDESALNVIPEPAVEMTEEVQDGLAQCA